MDETRHVSVMLAETITALRAHDGGRFLDCTLGGGGHSMAILGANSQNIVVGIDRDPQAVARTGERLHEHANRFSAKHVRFSEAARVLKGEKFDGVFADLGMSTDQLLSDRGFAFSVKSPLDMRMDPSQGITAAELLNQFSEHQLIRILKEGGVSKGAKALAQAIVRNRPINDTQELARIVLSVLRTPRASGSHPATVVFQAIRMAVNEEINELKALLQDIPCLTHTGSRVAFLTFHSTEDKFVASRFRSWASPEFSAHWPGSLAQKPLGKILDKKGITASQAELETNPSARSAKLRIFEFI